MRFSTSIEYAIHGLMYVARAPYGTPVLTAEVAHATGVPEEYLRKVFQQLARAGIVASRRGSKGGFLLSRSASDVNLKDIVESIDGSLPTYSCMRDSRKCDLNLPCPVHAAFAEATLKMAEVLSATSLSDLLGDVEEREPLANWLQLAGGV